ncbi:MAG TPA: methyltransferase domain-containing protein [Pirellulales bacterium]|nr:methyltransferase domain-containing protein [Pirellulales bacterium]
MRCPASGEPLHAAGTALVSESGAHRYAVCDAGIPVMADEFCSAEGRIQREHYDRIAAAYLANLKYPHTEEYHRYLDAALISALKTDNLGTAAEICCGRGEAFRLLGDRVERGIGLDVSLNMLRAARADLGPDRYLFVQGDATAMPLRSGAFDNVFMFGGIHHVNDRRRLFSEVFRILKPGGRFIWREPVSDFFLWRWLRYVIYKVSPALDFDTERPLRWEETVPLLQAAGFELGIWQTYGFFGFCLFENSDVLVFNRWFRFLPGIRALTRLATRLDDLVVRLPGFGRAGLQVVGAATRPSTAAGSDPDGAHGWSEEIRHLTPR